MTIKQRIEVFQIRRTLKKILKWCETHPSDKNNEIKKFANRGLEILAETDFSDSGSVFMKQIELGACSHWINFIASQPLPPKNAGSGFVAHINDGSEAYKQNCRDFEQWREDHANT